jgi:hypothetical protein
LKTFLCVLVLLLSACDCLLLVEPCPVTDEDRAIATNTCLEYLDLYMTACMCADENTIESCTAQFFDCPAVDTDCPRSCDDAIRINRPFSLFGPCFTALKTQAECADPTAPWTTPIACQDQVAGDDACR